MIEGKRAGLGWFFFFNCNVELDFRNKEAKKVERFAKGLAVGVAQIVIIHADFEWTWGQRLLFTRGSVVQVLPSSRAPAACASKLKD